MESFNASWVPKVWYMSFTPNMELFIRRRWRLYRPKWLAVVLWQTGKNYPENGWQCSLHVWLLGQSSCSFPSSKEPQTHNVRTFNFLSRRNGPQTQSIYFVQTLPTLHKSNFAPFFVLSGQSNLRVKFCPIQCDQVPDYFFTIRPFPTMKIRQKFVKVC